MSLDELEVGDCCRLILGEERDPADRRVGLTRWVHVEIVAIRPKSGRVTVRLLHYPEQRARAMMPHRLMR